MRSGCVPVGIGESWEVQEAYGRLEPRCPLLDLFAETKPDMIKLAQWLITEGWETVSAECLAWDRNFRARIRKLLN